MGKLRIRRWDTTRENDWIEVEYSEAPPEPRAPVVLPSFLAEEANLAQKVCEEAARLAGLRGPPQERACPFCAQANGPAFEKPGILFLEVEGEARLRRVEKLNTGWRPSLVTCSWVTRDEAQAEIAEAEAADREGEIFEGIAVCEGSPLAAFVFGVFSGNFRNAAAAQRGHELAGEMLKKDPCTRCGHGRAFHRQDAVQLRNELQRLHDMHQPEHACRFRITVGQERCTCEAYEGPIPETPKETL